MNELVLSHGLNDQLWDSSGQCYTDLLTGFGTTLLGHSNPKLVDALKSQAGRLWSSARIKTEECEKAKSLVDVMLPEHLKCAGFYSTGMEAAEFAMRVAREVSGENHFVGFERSMHGKSMATAALCWNDGVEQTSPTFRIPFFPYSSTDQILEEVSVRLESGKVGAFFLEPLQGSGGGYGGDRDFFQQLQVMIHESKALFIIDEVLLGFYRTGHRFYHESLGLKPDILITGKTMANGFPVSCISIHKDLDITPKMLPGSTFSENPLAMSTVSATLAEMECLNLPDMISRIESVVIEELSGLPSEFELKGCGAFWVIILPDRISSLSITEKIRNHGIILSGAGPFIRILPAATIDLKRLREACRILKNLFINLS